MRKPSDKQVSYSVPFAPWHFVLNAEGFSIKQQQIKPDGKNAYYYMVNDKIGLNVSLFIEPVNKCKTAKECSEMIWKSGNPGWVNPQNFIRSEIGDASVFEFLIPELQGKPIRQQNLYAQFVRDGYWIDLHVSKVLFQESDRAMIRKVVESASFLEKREKPIEDATKAIETWKKLWDEGNFISAYAALSTKITKFIDSKTWSTYYAGSRKPLGAVKSRSLSQTMYVNSLEGFPENEGWIFQYKTDFKTGKTVLETFALIRETDGTWKMINYINDL